MNALRELKPLPLPKGLKPKRYGRINQERILPPKNKMLNRYKQIKKIKK
jgi:hypothetical protein